MTSFSQILLLHHPSMISSYYHALPRFAELYTLLTFVIIRLCHAILPGERGVVVIAARAAVDSVCEQE